VDLSGSGFGLRLLGVFISDEAWKASWLYSFRWWEDEQLSQDGNATSGKDWSGIDASREQAGQR